MNDTCMVHDWMTCTLGIGDEARVEWEACRDCEAVRVIEEPSDEELQQLGLDELGIDGDWSLEWPDDAVIQQTKLPPLDDDGNTEGSE